MKTARLRLVVPFGPDGASDRVARIVAAGLAERRGGDIEILNLPGDGGLAGLAAALDGPADHTFAFATSSTHCIAPALGRDLPFDPGHAFVPLALAGWAPNLLLVRRGLAASLDECIELARRAHPVLTYASAGAGQTIHLCAELFARLAGVALVHRPYAQGSRAGLEDLAAGRVDLMFDNIAAALDLVQAGRIEVLAIAGSRGAAALPAIPALAERLPGYAADIWMGFVAPAGADAAGAATLARDLAAVIESAAVRAAFAALGVDADGRQGTAFARAIADNARAWQSIASLCGLRPS